MDLASLRNKIDYEGGIIGAIEEGVRDDDIDDEEMSEMWYEIQRQWENLDADMSEFEDELNRRIDDADNNT